MEPHTIDDDSDCEVRVDSGVVAGSMITQYYDPMISKLIVHSPNSREEAIHGLRKALNRYVIRGIGQNTAFLSDVLKHQAFVDGETPTNFIPMHYPDGFSGVKLSAEEEAEAVAITASVCFWRADILERPLLNSCRDLEVDNNADGLKLIVCVGGMFGVPYEVIVENLENGHFSLRPLANGDENVSTSSVILDSIDVDVVNPIVDVVVNGKEETLQIQPEDSTGVFEVTYQGANFEALVMTPEEFKMSQHMLEPKEIDTSNLILSPMPGTLMSYSVEVSR